jgi:hypothetical protein
MYILYFPHSVHFYLRFPFNVPCYTVFWLVIFSYMFVKSVHNVSLGFSVHRH